MQNTLRISLCSAALAILALPVAAQNSQSAPATGESIQQRKENQQDRIANRVQSGQLTAGETTNLEKKESTLNQQQKQLSRQIYRDKHNAAEQNTNPKSEVGKRAENQQDRIGQGIKSGQLTAGEAAHLEKNETNINREVRNDRRANGGKLTPQERKQVNRQQNKLSGQIYRDKHNGKRQ